MTGQNKMDTGNVVEDLDEVRYLVLGTAKSWDYTSQEISNIYLTFNFKTFEHDLFSDEHAKQCVLADLEEKDDGM